MSPTGIDQSWGYADPAQARAAGVQVVSMYLSWDATKNATAAKVDAYHRAGIGVLLNWEADAGAPLQGAGQGRTDATEAVRQARALIAAVGVRPANRVTIYFSCDRDVNAGQYGSIDGYYRAAGDVCHMAGFGVGAYGEAALISHLAAAKITDAEWQTLAWSGGTVSPDADFYQSSINNTLGGASVDFDRVIHASQLGAWWPAGSTYDQGDDMPLTDSDVQKVANAVWAKRYTHDGETASMASWVIYGNRFALAASKVKAVAVDAAQLATGVVAGIAKKLGG